ncbi:MAG: hypothetical protein ACE15C_10350 [Phycisphaerae bacterium]
MKTTTCLAAAPLFAVAILVLAGCGDGGGGGAVSIDHSSAKALVVSIHKAVAKKDYASIANCMMSDYRGSFKTILSAAQDYIAALESLADLIDRKIGPEEAARHRAQAESVFAGTAPDPLEGAIEDGKIAWEKVSLLDEGYVTAVMISGHATDFDAQFVLGEKRPGDWYMMPRLKDVPAAQRKRSFEKEAKAVDQTLRGYIKVVNRIKQKIRSGEINKGNFAQEMAAMAGEAGPPPSSQP